MFNFHREAMAAKKGRQKVDSIIDAISEEETALASVQW
jgi:hypothetical protein